MTPPNSPPSENLVDRLKKATFELVALEAAIRSAELDIHVLREFRLAANHVRQTAWIVEQWLAREKSHRETNSLLPVLNADRFHRLAQANRSLAEELLHSKALVQSEFLRELYAAVELLNTQLFRIFNRSDTQH